jgi:formamidopyrimidine-DNA glycosylase
VKHDHVDFVLDSGKVLRFHDPRRFGSILWVGEDAANSKLLKNLGPEPFDETLTAVALYRVSRGRKTSIKQFIMDGRVIVGVGNIYASEALFRAKIRPGRAAGRVTLSRFGQLLDAIRQVLSEAIKAGGTTLRDYSRVTGEPGYFEQSLDVYERAGQPCVNCATVIRRKVIGQRASYYCPRCQI